MNSEIFFNFQVNLLDVIDNYDLNNVDSNKNIIADLLKINNQVEISNDIKNECIANIFATFLNSHFNAAKYFWFSVEQIKSQEIQNECKLFIITCKFRN
jgi:hypothetical protein